MPWIEGKLLRVAALLAFAAVYFGLSRAGLALIEPSSGVAVIWPASGVALFVVASADRRWWPALSAAIFFANLLAQLLDRTSVGAGVGLAAVNALEPLIAAWLLLRVADASTADGRADGRWVAGLVAAATIASGITATCGAAIVVTAFGASPLDAWLTWWMADGLGMLTVAPMLFALVTRSQHRCVRAADVVLMSAATLAGVLVFWHPFDEAMTPLQYPYAAFPLLLWVGVRVGPRLVGAALLTVSAVASLATVHDYGPFARPGLDGLAQVQAQQGFLAVMVVSTLLVAGVVAERRASERRARGSADLLASVLRAATDFAVIGAGAGGVITVFNEGAQRMLGYAADDIVGRETPLLFHDAAEIVRRAGELGIEPGLGVFSVAARTGAAETRDWTFLRADGSRLTVSLTVSAMHDQDGERCGFIGIARDVTELRAAERELAESAERSRLLLAGLPDTIVCLTDRDLRCVAVDGLAPTGVTREQTIGRHVTELLPPDQSTRLAPLFAAALRGERSSIEYGASRSGRHFDLDIAPFRRNGTIEGVFVVSRDVTVRELARAAAVEASNAKSAFLATMSHELRTPLNGVLGMLELLGDTDLTETQRDYADTAIGAGDALMSVISDILDFSKIEAGKLVLDEHPFDLRELVHSTAAMLAPQAREKGIRLSVNVHDLVPVRVRGDAGRVRQVLTNLLSNAVKFTERGTVSVDVSSEDLVRLEVTDTGIGIDPEMLADLFDPFTQADASTTRRYGGTGLGLAIARELTEAMGGQLFASSRLGVGSTFAFTVALESADDSAARPPRDVAAGASHPRRVLVVEDNPVNQKHIRALLQRAGIDAELVDNGQAALARIDETEYDAVLMDCQLPGMDGYDTARAIRARETDELRIPIIALTAGALPEDRRRCLQAGMDDYISKPIRGTVLAAALSRAARADQRALIDPGHVLQLHRELPEIVDELVAIFAETTPVLLRDLRHAVEHADHGAIARTAHMLVGGSRSIGATFMATLAGDLERSETPQMVHVDRLETAFNKTIAAIRAVVEAPALSA